MTTPRGIGHLPIAVQFAATDWALVAHALRTCADRELKAPAARMHELAREIERLLPQEVRRGNAR